MTNLTCPINKTSVITCFQRRAAPTLSPPHKLSSEVFKTWCVPFMNDYSKWEGTLECLSRGIPVTIKPWQDGIMVGREKTSSSHYKWRHQQLRRVITFFPSILSSYLYANTLPRAPICQRGWISQFFYSDIAQGCRVSSTVGEIRHKFNAFYPGIPPPAACTQRWVSAMFYKLIWTPSSPPLLRYPRRIPFSSSSPFSSFCLARFLIGECTLD